MIAVVYGTIGELIKVAPVVRRLRDRDMSFMTITTAQQVNSIPPMLEQLGLPEPDLWLGEGRHGNDLAVRGDLPWWLKTVAVRFAQNRRQLSERLRSAPSCLMVHGDTMTTVLGALIGRALGLPVAHLEAGLRSFDWRNPFPEELDRLATSRLARIHFAPGDVPVQNLARARGTVINTHLNTAKDALDLVPDLPLPEVVERLGPTFGLVSIHREELINDSEAFRDILEVLADRAKTTPLVFIDHPVTVSRLTRHGFNSLFDPDCFVRIEKQPYFQFVNLLKRSSFAVTDSGGLQEECTYLDHPCVVHRSVTERDEGLDGPVLLSRNDLGEVKRFLDDPAQFRSRAPLPTLSPSDIVVDWLEQAGYGAHPSR